MKMSVEDNRRWELISKALLEELTSEEQVELEQLQKIVSKKKVSYLRKLKPNEITEYDER